MTDAPEATRTAHPAGWVVVVLAAACYWRLGLAYGTGDHEELLPQLLRLLDPSLYPTDPYLAAEDDAFSVRFVWLRLLWATSLAVGPQAAVLGWSVVAWGAVCWAAWRVAYAVVPDRAAAGLAVLLAVATVFWTPGSNALVSRTLTPESLAWAPALVAVERAARGRTWQAALALGACGWLQPLIGLQVGLLLGLVLLWRAADGEPRRRLAEAVGFGAVFFAVAAPVLLPTLLTQAGTAPPDDGLSTFFVTAELRQPHHYLLRAQPLGVLVRFAAVVAAGLAGLAVLKRRGPLGETRFWVRLLVVVAGLVVVYVAGTEGARSLTVAKMQFFRLTVVAKLVLLAWAAGAAVALAPTAWRRAADALLGSRTVQARALGWVGATALVGATVGLAAADVGRPAAMWHVGVHRQTDVYRAEAWIERNVASDALFLVPPSTTSFRGHARRSVAVNFKPTTFRDDAMHRWIARLRAVAPAPLPADPSGPATYAWRASLDSAYHATRDWDGLAERFGATHALVDLRETPTPPARTPLYASGPWAVFPVGQGAGGQGLSGQAAGP